MRGYFAAHYAYTYIIWTLMLLKVCKITDRLLLNFLSIRLLSHFLVWNPILDIKNYYEFVNRNAGYFNMKIASLRPCVCVSVLLFFFFFIITVITGLKWTFIYPLRYAWCHPLHDVAHLPNIHLNGDL